MVRIESGTVAVSTTDLRALAQAYNVQDAAEVEDLVALAKDAKRQSPWSDFRDIISSQALTMFDYEGSASILRQYNPLLIPGLIQTEEYTRACWPTRTGWRSRPLTGRCRPGPGGRRSWTATTLRRS